MSASRDPELDHLTEALRFELGKVIRPDIRDRVVNEILVHVDPILAADVGRAIGVEVRSMPSPRAAGTGRTPVSPAQHGEHAARLDRDPEGRRAPDAWCPERRCGRTPGRARAARGVVDLIAASLSNVVGDDGSEFVPRFSFLTTSSVLYDAVVVPGGEASVEALAHLAVVGQFLRPSGMLGSA